MIIDYTLINW